MHQTDTAAVLGGLRAGRPACGCHVLGEAISRKLFQGAGGGPGAGRRDGAWRNSGWITKEIVVPKANLAENWQ